MVMSVKSSVKSVIILNEAERFSNGTLQKSKQIKSRVNISTAYTAKVMSFYTKTTYRRRRWLTFGAIVLLCGYLGTIIMNSGVLQDKPKRPWETFYLNLGVESATKGSSRSRALRPIPVVVFVACGRRKLEVVSAIKAIILTADSDVDIHLFLERDAADRELVVKEVDRLRDSRTNSIRIIYHDVRFPPSKGNTEWKTLFKPCASQRLFLPDVLQSVDAVLYLDIDVLVLQPVSKVYSTFTQFNSTQLASAAPEDENPDRSWYKIWEARHPHYGYFGLNSGVMLMNLTRMRSVNMMADMAPILEKYESKISFGDQDILNIYYSIHPEMVFPMTCRYNYRTDHYKFNTNHCPSAGTIGIALLHGSRSIFKQAPKHVFGMVYNEFLQHDATITVDANSRRNVGLGIRRRFLSEGCLNHTSPFYVLANLVLKGITELD